MRTSFAAALALILGGPFGGCHEVDDSGSGKQPAAAAAQPAPGPAATASAPAAAPPLRVSVFLEYSGGMKGFVPRATAATQPTEFQTRVGRLLTETYSNPAVTGARFYILSKDTVREPVKFADLLGVVQGRQERAALGTELPDILSSVLGRPGAASEVSVIISDFVYGAADKSGSSQLPNLIEVALAPVRRRGLAVAVLGEVSRYEGTFHPAVITPVTKRVLKNGHLPYYAWVVGPPAAVARYLGTVLPADAAGGQQAFFGLSFPATPAAVVLPASGPLAPSGEASISFAGATASRALDVQNARQGAEFTVALNLSELPAAWQQPAFLGQNLQVQLPGGAASLVPGGVRRLSSDERNAAALAPYTHAVRLRLSGLPAGTSTLTLRLPAPEVPAWVAQWSTENDNLPGPVPHTYRLAGILAGLRAAFPAAPAPVFAATFTLAN